MCLFSLLLQFFLLLTCLWLELVFSTDTLSFDQSIRSSQVLISNGGTFKFGFFSPLNTSHYYVGVMYSVPVLTVVWVANRDRPLKDSDGTVKISENGNLVILDGQEEVVWSSDHSSPVGNYNATLSDTGNLKLQDIFTGKVVWESFQHASDSFVQKMRMSTDLDTNESSVLTSWRSPDDPAIGSYTTSLEPLDIPEIVVKKGDDLYWRSGPWNGQFFIGLPGMDVYVYRNGIDIVKEKPNAAYLTFSYPSEDVFSYFVINTSGVLQRKSWHLGNRYWEVVWSSIQSECDVYGKCGAFGICDPQATPMCTCLPGFEPKSTDEWHAQNWTSGCIKRTPSECETGKQDGFLKLERVKLPDNVRRFPSAEANCGSKCLNNCSCIAYAYYAGIGCMHWTGNLIDVQKFSTGGTDLYIRLAHSELDEKKHQKAIISAAAVLGVIIITVCIGFLFMFYRGSKKKHHMLRTRLQELEFFEYQILLNATCNFDPLHKLGEGGFGPVYKGKLSNGKEIAVKRLESSSNQGVEEFKNEVEVISKLQHRNLVRLLGFYAKGEERMLVYEYMPNGSLDAYLFDSQEQTFLDWSKRMVIVEGISRGLLYLHRDSRLRIIHRDLKASNILLDEELNPKISDFGVARIFEGKENHANTSRVVGTIGYVAPEYALEGIYSEKSDVFSFGILLLEIVSGRRNTSFDDCKEAQSLVAYAWKLWSEDNMKNIIHPLLCDEKVKPEILRCAHVGLLCVQETPQDRPNISTVLSMLRSEIVELPHPKRPAFTVRHGCSQIESSENSRDEFFGSDITITLVEGR